jgi:hypothetical protein
MSRRALVAVAIAAHVVLGAIASGGEGLSLREPLARLARGELGAPERDAWDAVLTRAAVRVPTDAAVLVLSSKTTDGYYQRYFRASAVLYPRSVFWASPDTWVPGVQWHEETPLEGPALARVLAEHGARFVLLDHVAPGELRVISENGDSPFALAEVGR